MARLRLIHGNATEAKARATTLRAAGHTVDTDPLDQAAMRRLRGDPPDAVVIDLSRRPAHGRDVGVWLRTQKATRGVPLVFLEGDPSKVARIRQLLPDAQFDTWRRARGAVERALARRSMPVVSHDSVFAAYTRVPLVKKLGVKPNTVLVLIGAPAGFDARLAPLPVGVTVRRQNRGRRDLTVWFVERRSDLERRLHAVAASVGDGALWIAWRKGGSAVQGHLTQVVVRRIGETEGLVDYKIASLDDAWSALLFTRRTRSEVRR